MTGVSHVSSIFLIFRPVNILGHPIAASRGTHVLNPPFLSLSRMRHNCIQLIHSHWLCWVDKPRQYYYLTSGKEDSSTVLRSTRNTSSSTESTDTYLRMYEIVSIFSRISSLSSRKIRRRPTGLALECDILVLHYIVTTWLA